MMRILGGILDIMNKHTYHGQHVGSGRMDPGPEKVVVHDNLLLGAMVRRIEHLHWHFVTKEFRF